MVSAGRVFLPLVLVSVFVHCSLACLPSTKKVHCPCEKDSDCAIKLNCTNCGNAVPLPPKCDVSVGECLNPYRDGCFRGAISKLDHDAFPLKQCLRDGANPRRICLDDDDRTSGRCDNSPTGELFRGREIYIAPQNWLSADLVATAAQVFMVEYMKYPVFFRYGGNSGQTSKGFYEKHIKKPIYDRSGVSTYELEAIKNGGCIGTNENNLTCKCTNPTSKCAHVQFEIWASIAATVERMATARTIERGGLLGIIGRIALMLPKWAVDKDNALATYRGFRDREKMARLFKRPVSWKEYCDRFYPNETRKTSKCPPPSSDLEGVYYHRLGNNSVAYHGYFDGNGKNNCTLYPSTCKGSAIILEACDWGDFSKFMIPLNNVSLAFHGPGGRGGYKLPHMSQIWAAAADRKEMVLMWWWKPDVLFFEYAGTEFEMFVVLFPESTKECRVVRQEAYKNLCKNELPQTLRNYSGAYCDDEPQVLQKVLSVSLQVQAKKINDQLFNDLYVPSPAYSFLKDYQFDGENLQKVFKRYYDIKRTHKYSQDRWKQIEKVAMSHSLCSVMSEEKSESRINWKSSLKEGFLCPKVMSLSERQTLQDPIPLSYLLLHIISIVNAVYCLLSIVWRAVVPKLKGLRLSSNEKHRRNYEYVLLVGISLVYIDVALSTREPVSTEKIMEENDGDFYCTAGFLSRYFSIVLTVVPLVCRLRSMTKIFASKKIRSYLPEESKKMIVVTLVIFLLEVVYLLLWILTDQAQNAPTLLYSNPYVAPGEAPVFYAQSVCPINMALSSSMWHIFIVLVEFCMTVFAVLLSVQNSYVETIFQDSDSIGMAVYNGAISQLIPLILYMNIANINQDGTINLLVSAACRWWTASALWAFYFNPRFTNIVTKTLRACANTNYYKSIKRIVSAKSDAWTIDAKEVEIQKTIGKGAYGTVLLGTYGNTKVAVKKFAKAALSNADFVAELVSLVDLRHKHLVQFVGAILNTHSLVIDYMERGTLNRILQDYSINLSAESLHAFASNIALGLEYLHSKGMTHCDMKSENILVDEHWVCKISDFGLSEFVKDDMAPTHSESLRAITSDRDDGESEENVPASSGPKGTLLYQPPEVTLGGEYTQSGDIFAFSLILYEIVTRKELFFDATSNAYQRVLQVANHNLRPTWVFDGPGLNEAEAEGIQKVAETCWDNNPEKRHSAAEACTKLLRGEDDTDGIETSGVKLANWTKNPNAKVDRSLDPGAQTARLPSGFDPSQHKWYVQEGNFKINDPPGDKCSLHDSYLRGKLDVDVSSPARVYAFLLKFRRGKKLKNIKKNEQNMIQQINDLSSCNHRALLKFIGCTWNPAEPNPTRFLLFEQVDERSFRNLKTVIIEEGPAIGWIAKLRVALDLLDALRYLHDKNIFHGRLSASEVFCLFQEDAPVLTKLVGIHRNIVKSNKAPETLSDEANSAGWLPPEILMLEQYTEAGDVFSMGVLLWAMLSHKMPFEGEPVNVVNRAIVNESARPDITMKNMESIKNFHFYNEEMKVGYVDIVNMCWSQKMDERPRASVVYKILKTWHKHVVTLKRLSGATSNLSWKSRPNVKKPPGDLRKSMV